MSLWPEISDRAVVVYGVGLRDYLRSLASESLGGPPPPEASLAANSVFSPLPLDVQVAIIVAVNEGGGPGERRHPSPPSVNSAPFAGAALPKSFLSMEEFGAGGGSRTHTALRPTDFESAASAIPHSGVLLQMLSG